MDEEKRSLETKAFKGLFWRFSERTLVQIVALVVSKGKFSKLLLIMGNSFPIMQFEANKTEI